MADLGSVGKAVGSMRRLHCGEVSGIVHDASDNPVARTVRAFTRDTGALLGGAVSSTTDGTYHLYCNVMLGRRECTVIEYDDAAGTQYNARVYDRVTPI